MTDDAKKKRGPPPPLKPLSELATVNQREAAELIIGCSKWHLSRMLADGVWKLTRTATSSDRKPRYEKPDVEALKRQIDKGEVSSPTIEADEYEQTINDLVDQLEAAEEEIMELRYKLETGEDMPDDHPMRLVHADVPPEK